METLSRTESSRLRERYRRLTEGVAEAAARSGRRSDQVLLVVRTDQASPDQIRQLVEWGQADLAESNVLHLPQRALGLQEFLGRRRFLSRVRGRPAGASHGGASGEGASPVPDQVRWHMLGPIPRNRIRSMTGIVRLVHSVDNLRVAEDLHLYAGRLDGGGPADPSEASEPSLSENTSPSGSLFDGLADPAGPSRGRHLGRPGSGEPQTFEVLLRINGAGDGQDHGVAPPAAIHLAEQIDSMVHLRLRGVCFMPERRIEGEELESAFARCAEIFSDIQSAKIGGPTFNILAMGDESNIERAVELGANMVYGGASLFEGQ
ncbi:MAG: hypothetical protein IT441_06085 [Phycisphaeraceae bacterium]|nr:hypothetical protein [Phycisphaeraceae bacterium]